MRLIGQEQLVDAGRKDAPLRKWLGVWVVTVGAANWQSLDDVRVNYPSADGVKLISRNVIIVFNVKGNRYRLLTIIDFCQQIVVALEVVTHSEYDKQRWKERY